MLAGILMSSENNIKITKLIPRVVLDLLIPETCTRLKKRSGW